jgi:hypothetical protein
VDSNKNENNENINIKLSIDSLEEPTDQDVADCFANTLKSTFDLDTNLFEHHQKANDFHLEKPFDPIPITIEELNEVTKKQPKRKAPSDGDITLGSMVRTLNQKMLNMIFLIFIMNH